MPQPTKYSPVYFAPDLDPAWFVNPGILTDVKNLVPTKRGTLINYCCTGNNISAGFSETTYSLPLTGVIHKKVDGTARLFVATDKRLMEFTDASTATDRSLGGTDYGSDTDHRYNLDWDSCSFGNDVIFVNKKNDPQVITASATAFTDLGGSPPKAACCTVNKNFVLLGNTNDGTDDLGDQVWWSALGNDASWTTSAATQAGNYRLRDTGGNVVALVNLRDAVIAYKEDSIYVGDYQGSPLLWTWRLITNQVGCASVHGVVVVDGIHYFLHRTGLYRFDGASVQPIGFGINSFLADKLGKQTQFATVHGAYDEYSGLVLWYFSPNSAGNNFQRTQALAYHPATGRFGFVSDTVESGNVCRCVIRATLSDITAWDSTLASIKSNVLVVSAASSTASVSVMDLGATTASTVSLTTGHVGDDVNNTKLTRVKPRLLSYSSISDASVKRIPYEAATDASPATFTADTTRARWDGTVSGRWLQATLTFTDFAEVAGLALTSVPDGTE